MELTAEQVALLESGCALVVGTTAADGAPHATRGWGLHVHDPAQGRMRVLVDDDPTVRACLSATGALAVTGADVHTLRSIQVKGRVEEVGGPTAEDRACFARYCDDFFGAVESVDHFPRRLMERLAPVSLAAVEVAAEELYDQTPGPAAGAALGSPA